MRLYLVRHGESAGNAARIHQSHDTPLSEIGRQQAKLLAKRFQTIPIDLILTSHYERAHQTAEYVAKITKKPLKIHQNIYEIRRPTSLLGRSIDDDEVVKIKELISKNVDRNWHYEDEENIYELIERARKFLSEAPSLSKENILAVSHGRFIVAIICVLTMGDHLTPELYSQISSCMMLSNTGITVLVNKNNRWFLETWNDNAHLGSL